MASIVPEIGSIVRLNHLEWEHDASLLFNFFLFLTVISEPVYFASSILLFKKLDIKIFNTFSTYETVNLNWLRKLVYIFGFIWTVLMIFTTIHHVFQMFSWIFCTHGLTLSLSTFIILIGYYGQKQKEIFVQFPTQNIEFITESKVKYFGTFLKDEEVEQYIIKIKEHFDTEKPYLNAEISLPDLANKLDIPPSSPFSCY